MYLLFIRKRKRKELTFTEKNKQKERKYIKERKKIKKEFFLIRQQKEKERSQRARVCVRTQITEPATVCRFLDKRENQPTTEKPLFCFLNRTDRV